MDSTVSRRQGDLALLEDEVARELLDSRCLARLAYNWRDGTPRVVPNYWFHWDGREFVVSSPPLAPKLKALETGSKVALTIDGDTWPYHVLSIRGTARADGRQGPYRIRRRVAPLHGSEAGDAWGRRGRVTLRGWPASPSRPSGSG